VRHVLALEPVAGTDGLELGIGADAIGRAVQADGHAPPDDEVDVEFVGHGRAWG
jgi:hypothetical protein